MGIVTLTGHLGAMGDVGVLVARKLGYKLVGRELVAEAAGSLGWTEQQAQEFDERTGGFSRWLTDLMERYAFQNASTGELITAYGMTYGEAAGTFGGASDQYLKALRAAMTAFADAGDVVLVGRGGQALFAERAGAIHVRIACPVDERVRRIARRDHIGEQEARTLVEESDKQREAWHSKYFGIDYRSPYHYDLVVNTGRLTDELTSSVVAVVVKDELLKMAR